MADIAALRVEPPEYPKIAGYLFVAHPDEIAAMSLVVGPTRPMMPGKRGQQAVPLTECAIPDCHHPSFFDALIGAVLPNMKDLKLETIRSDGKNTLFHFPRAVTDLMCKLTPDQPDFVKQEISSITDRMMVWPGVQEHYQRSGVSSAVRILRGCALKAMPRDSGKEVFYWLVTREP